MSLNEGTHRARVTDARLGETNKGTEYVALTFRVGDDEIVAWLWLTEKAVQRTVEALRVCGWQGDDVGDLATCIGGECEIVTANEEYQGRVSLKVKYVNEIAPTLAPERRNAIADRVRAAASKVPAKPPRAPAITDDVPF